MWTVKLGFQDLTNDRIIPLEIMVKDITQISELNIGNDYQLQALCARKVGKYSYERQQTEGTIISPKSVHTTSVEYLDMEDL